MLEYMHFSMSCAYLFRFSSDFNQCIKMLRESWLPHAPFVYECSDDVPEYRLKCIFDFTVLRCVRHFVAPIRIFRHLLIIAFDTEFQSRDRFFFAGRIAVTIIHSQVDGNLM